MTQSFTTISNHSLVVDSPTTIRQARSMTISSVSRWSLIIISLVTAAFSLQAKWSLATEFAWQCDEIPMFRRFTGAGAHVTNEAEAAAYQPSLYHARTGAMRSLRSSSSISAIHTTTGFWVNLSTQLFGVSALSARLMPMFWSMLAIAVAGAAGFWLTKRVVVGCVAATIVSLSPHAMIYGAQARGYAEAMALSPMLIIAMEWLRRQPHNRLRALLVVMVSIQLSLTVYTAWVYWTLPILALSVFLLPKYVSAKEDKQKLKSVMLIITGCLIGFMCFYTMDRWRSLSFTASFMGVPVSNFQDFSNFATNALSHLFGQGYFCYIPFLLIGLISHRKSCDSWWLHGLAVSAGLMLLTMMLNGSAGYPRNIGLWVVLLAVLVGVGFDRIMTSTLRVVQSNIVSVSVPIMLALVSIFAFPRAKAQAHTAILPDWGGMVQRIDAVPESVGPRWFARCLANHWQIDWYQPNAPIDRILAVSEGETIEVFAGFQYVNQHQEISYQQDIKQGAILPRPIPSYIASVPGTDIRGVPVRRWIGSKGKISDLENYDSETTVFMAISTDNQAMDHVMLRIETLGQSLLQDVVFFAQSQSTNRTVATLMAPRHIAARIVRIIHADRSKMLTVHAFALKPQDSIKIETMADSLTKTE